MTVKIDHMFERLITMANHIIKNTNKETKKEFFETVNSIDRQIDDIAIELDLL